MTTNSAPWQVTCEVPLIPGESLDGYVARVAAAHHMPRMAVITEVAGAAATARPHASFCEEEGLPVLADCLRVDIATLRHHAPLWSADADTLNFFGTPLPKDFLQFPARRFSPKALEISPHHRALWQLRVLPICSETWVYLVDRCPNPACGRQQVWRRTVGIDLCDFCAEPLTRAEARSVPEALRENLERLVGLVHPDPARRAATMALLPPRLAAMECGELLELVCALAPLINHRAAKPLHMRSLSLEEAADVIVPAIAGTWPLLQGWPHALEQHMVDRIDRAKVARVDGNRGFSFRLLTRYNKRGLSPAVAEVIGEFVAMLRNSRTRGITIREAMSLTGGRQRALCAMRRSGALPSVIALDGHQLTVLIDRRAVEDMVQRNKPRERLVRAAWRLGVPTYAIHQLVRDGELVAAPSPPGCSEQLAVYEESLSALEQDLRSQLDLQDESLTTNLFKLMHRIGARPKPWAKVLAAIRTGALVASLADGTAPLAQRIMVANEDVLGLPIFADDPAMDWSGIMVSKSDTAEIMNIPAPNLSKYCDFLFGPGGFFRDITMEEALTLGRTYIGTGEMGHRLGLHHTAARHMAEFRKVESRYPGLYSREAAEALIPEMSRQTIGGAPVTSVPEKASVEMLATVSPEGRLNLPLYLRRKLGLARGGRVTFEEGSDGVIMRALLASGSSQRTKTEQRL